MAFETVTPGEFRALDPLGVSECSIVKNGTLMAHSDALRKVRIDSRVVLLADPDNNRLAIRAMRDGEEKLAVVASIVMRKRGGDSGRRRIGAVQALKRLGLTGTDVAGRYELVTHKDELLFLTLPQPNAAKGKESNQG